MFTVKLFAWCLVTALVAGGCQAGYKVEELRLGEWGTAPVRLKASQDGLHVALLLGHVGKERVAVDGVPGPGYEEIGSAEIGVPGVVISPNGRRVAYVARTGKRWRVVVDGVPGPEYGPVTTLAFSPDSKRVGYLAYYHDGDTVLVVDGRPLYRGNLWGIVFSPNGEHVACDEHGNKNRWVLDGVPGPGYDLIGSLVFSPDGKRLAYSANIGASEEAAGESFVVLDGKPGPHYSSVLELAFSPDGKRFVYSAVGKKSRLVVDGMPGPEYDVATAPVFSPDGTRLAYIARRGKQWLMVVDGVEGAAYDGIVRRALPTEDSYGEPSPSFSADGKRFAYIAQKGKKFVAVIDGVEGPEYDHVSGLQFSPDGKRTAYVACDGDKWDKWWAVIDGKAVPEAQRVIFSPDGKRVAYVTETGRYVYTLVVDGKAGPGCDLIGKVVFSADGKHVACQAMIDGKQKVLLDGVAGPGYEGIVKGGPTFREDGSLQYLAWRDGSLYRVTCTPTPVD